ncbi:MAG: hypothetical protein AB1502_09245 [Thermodesulfobacteriota bacterium]
MLKGNKKLITGLMAVSMSLMATPAFARTISFKDAGIAVWIFLIIGAIIILLQLIPAIILFFSFIGTSTGIVAKRKKAMDELPAEEKEKVVLPGYEPAPVKK